MSKQKGFLRPPRTTTDDVGCPECKTEGRETKYVCPQHEWACRKWWQDITNGLQRDKS